MRIVDGGGGTGNMWPKTGPRHPTQLQLIYIHHGLCNLGFTTVVMLLIRQSQTATLSSPIFIVLAYGFAYAAQC